MDTISIYTDGSSRGNPGPGGFGTILITEKGSRKEISCGFAETTNNRMELLAAIAGLEALKRPCRVLLHSDSRYVVDALNKGWTRGWIKRGWRKTDKTPVKNPDLWKRLLAAAEPHDVTWRWVRGHAGHPENERCDELATTAADGETGPLREDAGYTPER